MKRKPKFRSGEIVMVCNGIDNLGATTMKAKAVKELDKELSEAVDRIYRKYGTDLAAFFRDARKQDNASQKPRTPTPPPRRRESVAQLREELAGTIDKWLCGNSAPITAATAVDKLLLPRITAYVSAQVEAAVAECIAQARLEGHRTACPNCLMGRLCDWAERLQAAAKGENRTEYKGLTPGSKIT